MPLQCPVCKEFAVAWEGYSGQGCDESQNVCTACGIVVEEGVLHQSYERATGPWAPPGGPWATSMSLPEKYTQKNMKDYIAEGLKRGRKTIKEIISKLNLSSTVASHAKYTFDKAMALEEFHLVGIEGKEHLAASCVYIAVLNNDRQVPLRQFCEALHVNMPILARGKKRIEAALNIKSTALNLMDTVDPFCKDAGLSRECEQTTKALVSILKELWIAEGRSKSVIVSVAMYLSWKAEDFPKRKKIPFKEFRRQHKMYGSVNIAQKRIGEVLDKLVVLGLQLPWLDESSVSKDNVLLHLQDILNFQKSLIAEAVKGTQNATSAHPTTDLETVNIKQEELPLQEPPTGQKRPLANEDFLLPPSFLVKKMKPEVEQEPEYVLNYKGDMNSEELTDFDVSESELKMYIRCEKEIKHAEQIQSVLHLGDQS